MKIILCFFIVIAALFTSCKSAEQKRIECEEYAHKFIKEWMDSVSKCEDMIFVHNYFDLIEEYGKNTPYKTFNHIKGMNSDTEGFGQQISKDIRMIKEVDSPLRYIDITKCDLKSTRIWFANDDDEKLSEEEINVKLFLNKDSLFAHFISDIYIWDDVDPEIFRKNLNSNVNSLYKDRLSIIREQKYLIFVHTEYEYPTLRIGKEFFESGIKCSRLQIFTIVDKKCLLDKRIFATTGDKVLTVYNKMIDELSIRTKYEVELQGHKIGIPYVQDPSTVY